ncbi:hypothetical protein SORBI_3009G026400 [Sorghum bicolor]|uniref:Uncharacterized protein n=2 Tax=Sorghum bicolor TaxID=4558 RepID=A0A1Z5R0J8_SORBI|nr:hypothetical protein SORBI_3009G026400 [Sorghum bicolor]
MARLKGALPTMARVCVVLFQLAYFRMIKHKICIRSKVRHKLSWSLFSYSLMYLLIRFQLQDAICRQQSCTLTHHSTVFLQVCSMVSREMLAAAEALEFFIEKESFGVRNVQTQCTLLIFSLPCCSPCYVFHLNC